MGSELTRLEQTAMQAYLGILDIGDDMLAPMALLWALGEGCYVQMMRVICEGCDDERSDEHLPEVLELVLMASDSINDEIVESILAKPIDMVMVSALKAAMVVNDLVLGYALTRSDGGCIYDYMIEPGDDITCSPQVMDGTYVADMVTAHRELGLSPGERRRLMSKTCYLLGMDRLEEAIKKYLEGRLLRFIGDAGADEVINQGLYRLMSAHGLFGISAAMAQAGTTKLWCAIGTANDATAPDVLDKEKQKDALVVPSVVYDFGEDEQVALLAGINRAGVVSIVLWLFTELSDRLTSEVVLNMEGDQPSGLVVDLAGIARIGNGVFDYYRDMFGVQSYGKALELAGAHLNGVSDCECNERLKRYMKEEVSLKSITSMKFIDDIRAILKGVHGDEVQS